MSDSPFQVSSSSLASSRAQEFDLLALLRPLHRYWILLFGLYIVFAIAIGCFWSFQRPKFKAEALLYLDSKSSSSMASSMSSLLPGLGSDPDVMAQQGILEGNSIAMDAIRENGLNAGIETKNPAVLSRPFYWQWLLQKDPSRCGAGLRVTHADVEPGRFLLQQYAVVLDGRGGFMVHDRRPAKTPWDSRVAVGEKLAEGVLGVPVQLPGGHFTLAMDPGFAAVPGEVVGLDLYSAAAALEEFDKDFDVSIGGTKTKTSNLLTLSFTHKSPTKAQKVIESVIANYTAQTQREAVRSAQLTFDFVTQQAEKAQKDLEKANAALAAYQQASGLIDLSPQMQVELTHLVQMETELRNAKLDRANLRALAARLTGPGGASAPPAELATLDDPTVRQLAGQLAQNEAELAILSARFRPGHETVANKTREREALLAALNKTAATQLEIRLKALDARVVDMEAAVQVSRDRMAVLPQGGRQLAELLGNVKTADLLHETLLLDQNKASAAVASTLTNIHVKDPPIVALQPISPKKAVVLGSTFVGSLFLAAFLVILFNLRVRWFESVEEAETAAQRPVFAILPHTGTKAKRAEAGNLVLDRHGPYAEAVRHLRSNLLQTTGGKHQVIMTTSCMPGDGKTLTSTNLAATLARSERINGVLLVDADMHAPSLHGVFGLPQSPGLSDYLNGSVSFEEILHVVDLGDGCSLQVVTAGPTPAAASDLIDSEAMRALVVKLRETYAFTVLDLPPFPLVSVASTLAPQVDRILSVCRIGKTWRAIYLRHLESLAAMNPKLGLVLNVPNKGVGGGYGYGYGYGYGSYGYGQKK